MDEPAQTTGLLKLASRSVTIMAENPNFSEQFFNRLAIGSDENGAIAGCIERSAAIDAEFFKQRGGVVFRRVWFVGNETTVLVAAADDLPSRNSGTGKGD